MPFHCSTITFDDAPSPSTKRPSLTSASAAARLREQRRAAGEDVHDPADEPQPLAVLRRDDERREARRAPSPPPTRRCRSLRPRCGARAGRCLAQRHAGERDRHAECGCGSISRRWTGTQRCRSAACSGSSSSASRARTRCARVLPGARSCAPPAGLTARRRADERSRDSAGGLCAYLNLPDGRGGDGDDPVGHELPASRCADGYVEAVSRPLSVGRNVIAVDTEVLD